MISYVTADAIIRGGRFKALRTMRPHMVANFGGRKSYFEYLFWFYKIMYIILKFYLSLQNLEIVDFVFVYF